VIVPSIVTIFLCSMLLAASLSFFLGAMRGISHRDAFYEIEAFFVENPGPAQIDSLRQSILSIKPVEAVRYIDPDQAKEEFRTNFSAEMLDLVEGNPLPASFRITLQPKRRNPMDLESVMGELNRWQVFDMVQAPLAWSQWIERWRFDMVFWPLLVSFLLLVTLGLIIGNAVRLTLYSRRLLVENMKYAGGSYFFIQFPFVLEGFMQGVIGSSAAVLVWALIVWSLESNLPVLVPYLTGLGYILVSIVLVVSLIGTYASYRSVRVFLQKSL
jgi:cell division transport system permease protein